MSNFKAGDKVRCVDDKDQFPSNLLTAGSEYVVESVNRWGEVFVAANDGKQWSFLPERFVLSEFYQKPTDLAKYVIVQGKNKEFLEQVNELIAKGYKPQGGVVVDQQFYIQALVLGD